VTTHQCLLPIILRVYHIYQPSLVVAERHRFKKDYIYTQTYKKVKSIHYQILLLFAAYEKHAHMCIEYGKQMRHRVKNILREHCFHFNQFWSFNSHLLIPRILSSKSLGIFVSMSMDRARICFLEKYRTTNIVPIIPSTSPMPKYSAKPTPTMSFDQKRYSNSCSLKPIVGVATSSLFSIIIL
jgi:hypothetical protein